VYMDVLVDRLRRCGVGCNYLKNFVVVCCMPMTLFLSHILSALCMLCMLHVCDIFAIEYDLKFNTTKSAVIRVGSRCASLMLAGQNLCYDYEVSWCLYI